MALAEHQKVLDEKEGRYLWDLAHPSGYGNRMGRYRTQVELEFLFRHLPAARSRVLDVGGGSGRLGAVMSARGHEVTLLDKNPQALALAAGKGLARMVQADFQDFAEKDFDVVVCMEVLEYFTDCGPVLARCGEILKPGGLLVFCIINSQSWRFKLQQAWGNHCGANAFSLAQVERALAASNLQVIERSGFQWCLARTGSDSRLVTVSAAIERALGLRGWHTQSPWLLYAGRKLR